MTTAQIAYTQHPTFPVGQPLLQIGLVHNGSRASTWALVDSGASINILPHDVGLQLGFVWDVQTVPIDLGGVLAGVSAYAVAIETTVAQFLPVKLAFAWTDREARLPRAILGQVNFFQQFNVCFYGQHNRFEITPIDH